MSWSWSGVKPFGLGSDRELKYTFHFVTKIPVLTADALDLEFRIVSGDPEVEHLSEHRQYTTASVDTPEPRTEEFLVSDVPKDAIVQILVDTVASDASIGAMPLEDGPIQEPTFLRVSDPLDAPLVETFSVKPYNLPVDADPLHGIEYEIETGVVNSDLTLLSPDAPRGRFIAPFGDRLFSLRDFEDRQVIAASADGLVETWAGDDTAYFSLLDAASDPIDDLMGMAHLGPGVAALFRKRSIHRVYETGRVEVPIAVAKWLEQIGTESPFSIRLVDKGIAFLGHDKMVYILTEQGHQAVSPWIHDQLIEKLADADLGLVDSAYNSVTGEYYLGIPIGDSNDIEETWILDVKRMWLLQGQEQPWRRRPGVVGRFGSVSQI